VSRSSSGGNLSERGEYDICRVCFREDDGTLEASAYSGPNHRTLGEARANFDKLGAVAEREVAFVMLDGGERYVRTAASHHT